MLLLLVSLGIKTTNTKLNSGHCFFAFKRSQPALCNGRGGAVRERCYFEIPEWPMHLEKKKGHFGIVPFGAFTMTSWPHTLICCFHLVSFSN